MTDFVRALYGDSTPPDSTPTVTTPLGELAKTFYDTPPPPPAQPEPGQWFDRYAMLKSEFGQHAAQLHDVLGVSAESRENDDRAFVTMAGELGLDDPTTIALHKEIVRGLVSAATPADANADTEAAAARQARDTETRRTLREELGETVAADVMARTEALIARTPRLQELLGSDALAGTARPFLLLARHVAGR